MSGSSARQVALDVLLRWEETREGADRLLSRALDRSRLSPQDRDFTTALVYGTFRWRGRIDWQLQHLVSRPLAELDPAVLAVLRLGIYQHEHLDRVPAHAIVDTAVELTKQAANRGAAGLVNAVLRHAPRKLAQRVDPDPQESPVDHLVARTSHPAWLIERWLDRIGFERTLALAAANNEKPSLTLRPTAGRYAAAHDLIAELDAKGIEAVGGRYLPQTVRLPGGWTPAVGELLARGDAVVQDEAAGLVALVARPARGVSVLDVCAAPGGKAIQLAELCGEARIVAADRSPHRLRRVAETLERTGISGVYPVAIDGLRPATVGGFDRVLVDAPCSNTGVLGRRPDARWRRRPEDLVELPRLQLELLEAARGQVSDGGLLVYSTCSLEPEENEAVVRAYLARHPDDTLEPAPDVLPRELVVGECLRTDPTLHGMDGAFAAAIRPRGRGPGVEQ